MVAHCTCDGEDDALEHHPAAGLVVIKEEVNVVRRQRFQYAGVVRRNVVHSDNWSSQEPHHHDRREQEAHSTGSEALTQK